MRKSIFFQKILLSGCLCIFSPISAKNADYTQYVNPFIGTLGNGHCFPCACLPLGLVQAGPVTGYGDWEHCSSYQFNDSTLYGFSQTRLNGTGCFDLSDLLLFPFVKKRADENFMSKIDKNQEKASPGFYSVFMQDDSIQVDITTTERVAFYNYKFPMNVTPKILMDLQLGIRIKEFDWEQENAYTFSGHVRSYNWVDRDYYFVIKLDRQIMNKEELPLRNGKEKVGRFIFSLAQGNTPIKMKIAFSSVSVEGAKRNMAKELPNWDFEEIRYGAREKWNNELKRIEIKGSHDEKSNFYTSLYHFFIQPNNIADVDAQYRGVDNKVYRAKTPEYYSTFSLWDTYRAFHPLYEIIAPERASAFVNSMLSHYKVQGFLPIWTLWGKENYCMIGNHAIPVVVSAALKNLKDVDQEEVYEAVKGSSTQVHLNSNWNIYNRYGYYPFDSIKVESVSRTLETCYDDYCVARLAKFLHKKKDYLFFNKRSQNWKNLFDKETGYARGKDSKGNWRSPFDPIGASHAFSVGGDYTEANATQYTWHVQQDPEGLMKLMGGRKDFRKRLDSLFYGYVDINKIGNLADVTGLIGQYAHGNEPSHHIAYLYTLAGYPQKTQELIREIFNRFYTNRPDGLCGNDDCGQMSAWYIFSSMGFYPVNTITGEYILGAPQVPEVLIHLSNGKQVKIIAKNLSDKNKYVRSVTWNGIQIKNNRITYNQIQQGGELVFIMDH